MNWTKQTVVPIREPPADQHQRRSVTTYLKVRSKGY